MIINLDKKNGDGIYYYDNGDKFEGKFIMGVATGKGNYYYNDGSEYEGEYVNDKKEGYGIYIDKDGNKYEFGKRNQIG